MIKNKIQLGELFFDLDLIGEYQSFRDLEVSGIQTLNAAQEGDLVFIAQDQYLKPHHKSSKNKPAAIVVSALLWEKAKEVFPNDTLLQSKDAMLAMAKVSKFFQTESFPNGIHETAVVHPNTVIGKNISIGAYSVIHEGVCIGDHCVIQNNVSIKERTHIGSGTQIFSGVVIYQDTKIGERVRIHANSVIGADGFGYVQEKTNIGVKHVKIHHRGAVIIGDEVEIGALTAIDRGTIGNTVIEKGCIIDNQVQIGHNCHLEEGVIICGNVGFAGSVRAEKFSVVGGMCGVANRAVIGAGAIITGFSAVTGSVPAKSIWGGVPAQKWREYLRMQALFSKLPRLIERMKEKN